MDIQCLLLSSRQSLVVRERLTQCWKTWRNVSSQAAHRRMQLVGGMFYILTMRGIKMITAPIVSDQSIRVDCSQTWTGAVYKISDILLFQLWHLWYSSFLIQSQERFPPTTESNWLSASSDCFVAKSWILILDLPQVIGKTSTVISLGLLSCLPHWKWCDPSSKRLTGEYDSNLHGKERFPRAQRDQTLAWNALVDPWEQDCAGTHHIDRYCGNCMEYNIGVVSAVSNPLI